MKAPVKYNLTRSSVSLSSFGEEKRTSYTIVKEIGVSIYLTVENNITNPDFQDCRYIGIYKGSYHDFCTGDRLKAVSNNITPATLEVLSSTSKNAKTVLFLKEVK